MGDFARSCELNRLGCNKLFLRRLDLSHAPWHKATDPYVWIAIFVWIAFDPLIDRPDHGPPNLVRFGNDGIVWHIDPDRSGFDASRVIPPVKNG